MATHSPERKAEQGLLAWFGGISGVTVRSRFSGKVLSLPAVEVICDACEAIMRDEVNLPNIWECQITVRCRTRYEKQDTEEGQAHDDLVARVADMMIDSGFIAGLNEHGATFDYRINLWKPGQRRNMVNEQEYWTELTGLLWLIPSAN